MKTAAKVVGGLAAAGAALGATAVMTAKTAGGAKAKGATADIASLFSPLDDRLIIEATEPATRTAGGLFIPDTVDVGDRPKQGKVLAVGRGHQDKKGRIRRLDVQVGDTVLFESYMGSPLQIGSRDCLIIRESQLLGIVKS